MARDASKRTKKKDQPRRLRDVPGDRPGLPAEDSIEGVETFVSPQNETYTILHTSETDAYDEPPPRQSKPDS